MRAVSLFIDRFRNFKNNISILGIVYSFIYVKKIDKLNHVEILFLCHDNSRSVIFENKFFSPHIDTIGHRFANNSKYTIALPFSKLVKKNAFGSIINLNLYVIMALFKRVFFNKNINLKNPEFDPLITLYKRILLRINPKIIIGVQPSFEWCIAARFYKIPICDVQHGVIDVSDIDSYYSHFRRSKYNENTWPNYILCRNEATHVQLTNNSRDLFSSYNIGDLNNYFFSKLFSKQYSSKKFDNENKNIVYSLQPFYDKEFTEQNCFEKNIVFSKDVLKFIMKNLKNYNFIIKLHPAQIKNEIVFKKYMKFFKKHFINIDNIDYLYYNYLPINACFDNAILHITYNSATFYDAIENGIRTYFLDNSEERLMQFFGDSLNDARIKELDSLNIQSFSEIITNPLKNEVDFKIIESYL